jgi:hypothetical protein
MIVSVICRGQFSVSIRIDSILDEWPIDGDENDLFKAFDSDFRARIEWNVCHPHFIGRKFDFNIVTRLAGIGNVG